MDLGFEHSEHEGWLVLAVTGEIDVYTAPALRSELQTLTESEGVKLALDLRKVDFMDSTGLGVLIGTHKRLQASSGALAVVCGQPTILKVFEITGLDAIIPVRPTLDEAVLAT